MKYQYKVASILMLLTLDVFCTTLLIKIPTRSRPEKFFSVLDLFYQKLSGEVDCQFLITCDSDDATMNTPKIREKLASYPNLHYSYSKNSSKVDAYNKDLDKYDFDIVVLAADDMEPAVVDYDKIIVNSMKQKFPHFDGVLNFNDGHIGSECNTVPIIGKNFYDMFGYAYNPIYKSLFCDSELTCVSRILGKEAIFDAVVIRHNHPVYQFYANYDQLYEKNESFWSRDQAIFHQRSKDNFDIDGSRLKAHHVAKKEWSILICTLEKRAKSFDFIYNKLRKQIHENGLEDKVEVLFFSDNGENKVGFKRNYLLSISKGTYVNFLDDDDDIHENYIKMIYEKIQRNPDCISLAGIITFDGIKPKKFVHSIKYNSYFEENGIYYRPPNHLNTMKKSIAIQFKFPEISSGEDTDWAMQIAKSGLLKTEQEIHEPYYFYLYVSTKQSNADKKRYGCLDFYQAPTL